MADRDRGIRSLGLVCLGAAGLLLLAALALAAPPSSEAQPSRTALPAVAPVAVTTPPSAPASGGAYPVGSVAAGSAAVGRALFQAKGCVTCHRHTAIAEPGLVTSYGPDLSRYRGDPALIRRRLTAPASFPTPTTSPFAMPDLDLRPAEVEALIAFLNNPGGR